MLPCGVKVQVGDSIAREAAIIASERGRVIRMGTSGWGVVLDRALASFPPHASCALFAEASASLPFVVVRGDDS